MRNAPAAIVLFGLWPALVVAQAWQPVASPPVPAPRAESVMITAGSEYKAGTLHKFFLGANYRELWTTPINVPVLDLRTFAGGLHPTKKGGGMQTESLRLMGKDGQEYVFRTVHKVPHLPGGREAPGMTGSIALGIFADQASSEHPAGAIVAAPLLEAAGVLHATPMLCVMPNDSLLGEFEKEFGGRLGMVEQYPGKPAEGGGFAGAVEIVDSDTLLARLNRDAREHVDPRAFLTARLMDMFLNDADRHAGQWKWARMQPGHESPWVAIPRDRDQALVTYAGAIPAVARMGASNIVRFAGPISVAGLTSSSVQLDRRLLSGLEKSVWDSISSELTTRLTDSVIDAAARAMPAEYSRAVPSLARTLKERRSNLRDAANEFYMSLATIVDVHLTDAADRLTVTRLDDGIVDVRADATDNRPFFHRRFDARETREIRVYMHGGDDSARVVGNARRSIPVTIIGGNGTNWLVDSSTVDGEKHQARLFEAGRVEVVTYGKDTLFDRLPWIHDHGKAVPPGHDRGASLEPFVGVSHHPGLGITPYIGVNRYTYAFRDPPYSSLLGAEARYAIGLPGLRVDLKGDKRWEGTPLHLKATAMASQFEVLGYRGLGNATADSASGFFDVRQWQWRVRPAVAYALGDSTDLTLGPLFQYTVTDSTPNRFVARTRPYGFDRFGEVGVQLGFHHGGIDSQGDPRRRVQVDLTAAFYPAVGDVTSAFEKLDAHAGAMFIIPIPTRPGLVLRAGATKLYGTFPFFESAFVGGDPTLRRLDPQRYAGDASVFAASELRVPLVSFAIIYPFAAGIIGTAEGGRVYVDGRSPGGWHTASGGGIWVGKANQSFILSCTVTNETGSRRPHCQTGLNF